MKTIEINGEMFEIKKVNADRLSALTSQVKRCAGFDLYNYYANPSTIKRNIWKDWRYWSLDCDDCMIKNYFCVTGANCNQFTIGTLSELGVIIITKSHNYLYTLK